MKKLLPTDKGIEWYLEQMQPHVEEIKELLDKGDEIYKGEETCREHARIESYDLIVLVAEAFDMPEILESVPDEIIERFNRKRGKA